MLFMSVVAFLIGPSAVFHLPNSSTLIGVGIFSYGSARGICYSLCPGDALIGGLDAFPDN